MRQDNETVLDEDDGDDVEAHGSLRQDNETVLEDEETAE